MHNERDKVNKAKKDVKINSEDKKSVKMLSGLVLSFWFYCQ